MPSLSSRHARECGYPVRRAASNEIVAAVMTGSSGQAGRRRPWI